jgi:hypothetical protein
MKAKSLFWLLVVAALIGVLYFWAWPQLQNGFSQNKGQVPRTVVIRMPTPGG